MNINIKTKLITDDNSYKNRLEVCTLLLRYLNEELKETKEELRKDRESEWICECGIRTDTYYRCDTCIDIAPSYCKDCRDDNLYRYCTCNNKDLYYCSDCKPNICCSSCGLYVWTKDDFSSED